MSGPPSRVAWTAFDRGTSYKMEIRRGFGKNGFTRIYLSTIDQDKDFKRVSLTDCQARAIRSAADRQAIKLARRAMSAEHLEDTRMQERPVNCPYCDKPAEWVDNAEIYGQSIGRNNHMAYLCRPCEAWVGCHENTRRPLGRLANRELRRMRADCHLRLDFLWEGPEAEMTRQEFYLALKELFGADLHIGHADEGICCWLMAIDIEEIRKCWKKGRS